MSKVNKYGLSRSIPSKIKKEIRKRCGFGCVICGLGFYDYEHFEPDFFEAQEHNPKGMTLLCSQCNQKRKRGTLSAHTVAMADLNPKCLQRGFSSELFDFGINPIYVKIAGVKFYDCQYLIVINEVPLFSVLPPKEKHQPVSFSGRFTDKKGKVTLNLIENEWRADVDTWDIECVGRKITVRRDFRDIALILTVDPPNGITINRIDMVYKGVHLIGNEDTLNFSPDGTSWSTFNGCNMSHCTAGIVISTGPEAANAGFYGLED